MPRKRGNIDILITIGIITTTTTTIIIIITTTTTTTTSLRDAEEEGQGLHEGPTNSSNGTSDDTK